MTKELIRRTSVKFIVLSTAVILTSAWPTTQGLAADAETGKTAYEKNCAGCHGADGKGNPAQFFSQQEANEGRAKSSSAVQPIAG
jgi:mono/diheme cytochrome c family protein